MRGKAAAVEIPMEKGGERNRRKKIRKVPLKFTRTRQ